MDRLIAFRVTLAPEFAQHMGASTLVVNASSFIFEQEGTPIPMASFQVEIRDEETGEFTEYETVACIPTRAILLMEKISIEADINEYFLCPVNKTIMRRVT